MTTWDMLIPTLPHRHEKMCGLLAEFDKQWQPGFGVIVYRDNLQRPNLLSYGKSNDLLEMSAAEYVSWMGDDDFVAPDFVARIMEALESKPDYVGFPVRYTFNGQLREPVEHSLKYDSWGRTPQMLYRDIVHTNPTRRELALLTSWTTEQFAADEAWASKLRATGKVQTEVWIPEPMYYYQCTSDSWSHEGRVPQPLPESEIRPLQQYPWLTVRDEA